MCQPWYYPFNSLQKTSEGANPEQIFKWGDHCYLRKIISSSTLAKLIMPTMAPSWPCKRPSVTIMLLFCPTRLMVTPFMITAAVRLSSLASHSKWNPRELWGTIGFSLRKDRSKESSSCTLPVIRSRKGVAFWTLKYCPIPVVTLSWMWFPREMQLINRFI